MVFSYVDTAALERIEAQADGLLDTVGIDLEDHPDSLEAMRALGARIDGKRVRIDGAALREFVRGSASASFLWRGRNEATSLTIGDGQSRFLPVYGSPNVRLETGQMEIGTIEIYRDLIAHCDEAPGLHSTGSMVCFVHGLDENEQHLRMAEAHLNLSDKPFMGTVLSKKALNDVIDLMPEPAKDGECNLLHLINATPPLTYKKNPLECLQAASVRGECSIVSSYMMMGATGPVTAMGAAIQGYAEVLVGLALSQMYRQGCPVLFGLYGVPFSMTKMIPVFGDQISSQIQMIGIQLARRLGVPCRGDGGVTNAKIDDAQAGYDGCNATMIAMAGGADVILHSAGWAEGGRCTDVAKLIREGRMLKGLAAGMQLIG